MLYMPFVQAKCPNCGGMLAVDSSKDAAICQFCNTPFVVEKAINNYNITNNNYFSDGTVVNLCGNTKDYIIEAGVLKKYVGESEKAIIPSNVKKIGEQAFVNSAIQEVEIPDSVTIIDRKAFSDCKSLQSIILPDSITSIDEYAFANCDSLQSIGLPNSIKSIGLYAFYGCRSLQKISLPYGLQKINSASFSNCTNLKDVIIPDSVTEICANAFGGCTSLENVFISKNVSVIGGILPWGIYDSDVYVSAFNMCSSLKNIDVDKNNNFFASYSGILFNKNSTEIILYPTGKKEENYVIPNGIKIIKDSAFCGCKSLKYITIPGSVVEIGGDAFLNCVSLRDVSIPNSVKNIRDGAFSGCKSLSVIKIPKNANVSITYAFDHETKVIRKKTNLF